MALSGSRLRLLPWLCLATALVACDNAPSPSAVAEVAPASLPAPRAVRFVKLEEVSEWNNNAWAAVAEFNLLDATGATIDRKGWTARADSHAVNDVAQHAIDGDKTSLWHTPWEGGSSPPPPHWLAIDLGATVKVTGFRYLARQDNTVNGTIARYRFYVSNDGVEWSEPVASGTFADMGAPQVEKTVVFAAQTVNHPPVVQPIEAQATPFGRPVALKIPATDPDGDPLVFVATGLPDGLTVGKTGQISGTPIKPGAYAVNISVTDNKGASTNVALGWTVQAPVLDGPVPAPGEARFVKLEEETEVNGQAWASVAEFNLLDAAGANLPRQGWVASADSADLSDTAASAIDGNPATVWHSQWDGLAPRPPHSLIVDLGRPMKVRGFRYLPRQDTLANGTIAKFKFYVSANGVDWGGPVAEGDFSTMGDPKKEKTVMLK